MIKMMDNLGHLQREMHELDLKEKELYGMANEVTYVIFNLCLFCFFFVYNEHVRLRPDDVLTAPKQERWWVEECL